MNETEKVMRRMQKYLDEHASPNVGMDNLDDLETQFMTLQNIRNRDPLTEKTAKTSDDWLELAQDAFENDDKSNAFRLARKALKLDSANYDAELISIQCGTKDVFDYLSKLGRAVANATKGMEKNGYMDKETIGHFWEILATRPYMRLRSEYASTLVSLGMMRQAMAEHEELVRLSENDNIGARFMLMNIYAYLEEEEKALALHEQYDNSDETMLLFPLSILYFKKMDFAKAEKYLRRIEKRNKDLKSYIGSVVNNSEYPDIKMSEYGYRPFTAEELAVEVREHDFLMDNSNYFFRWANDVLKGGGRR